MGIILLPVIIVIFAVVLMFSAFGNAFTDISSGGSVKYDEETFQDYANEEYAAVFGNSSAYEDNIMLVFLVDEEHYNYYYIAWVGDHIVSDINNMFGNERTELGRAIASCVNTNSYKYSLDSNLAQVFEKMTAEIEEENLTSSFKCNEDHIQTKSYLINKSEVPMTEQTVNDSLDAFTSATGIPAVIVVDEAEDVFGKTINMSSIIMLIIAVALIVLAVYLIVRGIRRRNSDANNDGQ